MLGSIDEVLGRELTELLLRLYASAQDSTCHRSSGHLRVDDDLLESAIGLAYEEVRGDHPYRLLDLRPVEELTHLVARQIEERTALTLHLLDEERRQAIPPEVEDPSLPDPWDMGCPLHTIGANQVTRPQQTVDEGGHTQMILSVGPFLGGQRAGRKLTVDHPRIVQWGL